MDSQLGQQFARVYLSYVRRILEQEHTLIDPAIFSVLERHLKAMAEGYEVISEPRNWILEEGTIDNVMETVRKIARSQGYSEQIVLIPGINTEKSSPAAKYYISNYYYPYALPLERKNVSEEGLEKRVRGLLEK